MKFFNSLLLALLLGAGVVSLAGHSAIHAGSAAGQCLMCASYSDLDNTTFAQEGPPPAEQPAGQDPEAISTVESSSVDGLRPQPRAPPVTS